MYVVFLLKASIKADVSFFLSLFCQLQWGPLPPMCRKIEVHFQQCVERCLKFKKLDILSQIFFLEICFAYLKACKQCRTSSIFVRQLISETAKCQGSSNASQNCPVQLQLMKKVSVINSCQSIIIPYNVQQVKMQVSHQ